MCINLTLFNISLIESYVMDTQTRKEELNKLLLELKEKFGYNIPTVARLAGITYNRLRNIKNVASSSSPSTEELNAVRKLIKPLTKDNRIDKLDPKDKLLFESIIGQLAKKEQVIKDYRKMAATILELKIEHPSIIEAIGYRFDEILKDLLKDFKPEIEKE